MKTILTLLVSLLTFMCFSQETQDYYVVVKENHSIEPTQKTTLSDGKLSLTFSQQELQSFLTINWYINTKKHFRLLTPIY